MRSTEGEQSVSLCFFRLHGAAGPCDGSLDRCHLVPKRVLRREWALANPRLRPAWFKPTPLTGTNLEALLDDPRNWVAGCRAHHHRTDYAGAPWPLIPEEAREFASDFGLENWLGKLCVANKRRAA